MYISMFLMVLGSSIKGHSTSTGVVTHRLRITVLEAANLSHDVGKVKLLLKPPGKDLSLLFLALMMSVCAMWLTAQ